MRILATIPVLAFGAMLTASAAPDIRAGQWEANSQIVHVEAPGMPAQIVNMMKGQKHSFSYCLTQAEIDDSPKAMFDQTDGQCEYTEFSMANGRLDAKAICTNPMGNMQMHMTGTYTPTSYQSKNRMTVATPQGTMTMHATASGRHAGAC